MMLTTQHQYPSLTFVFKSKGKWQTNNVGCLNGIAGWDSI